MIRKKIAFLMLLSLSCLHVTPYSWASGMYYPPGRTQVLTDSKFHTQRLREVTENCMKNDADRKKGGEEARIGDTVLSDQYRKEIIGLIKKGADPDIVFYEDPYSRDHKRWSLVEIAAAHDQRIFLKFLLDQGASSNRLSGNSRSPLERAVDAGSLRAVRLLLERGADLEGGLLFRLATHKYRLLKYIEKPGLTVAMAELLMHYGANVLSRNSFGQTPVEVAQERIDYNNDPKDNRSKKLLIECLKKKQRAKTRPFGY